MIFTPTEYQILTSFRKFSTCFLRTFSGRFTAAGYNYMNENIIADSWTEIQ